MLKRITYLSLIVLFGVFGACSGSKPESVRTAEALAKRLIPAQAKSIVFREVPADTADTFTLSSEGGKIVVAAAVRQENHTVMPIGSNIDRIDIYCYDMAKKTLRVEHHPMADHETHRLSNTREGSTPRHHWVQFGQIDQTMADSTGGYVMVDQSWSVTVDGMPSERHRSGMMLMRVDENGHIQWVHTHRLDINANWRDKAGAAHRWKATPHGVMLAWTDHPGNVTAAPGRAVKTFRPFKAKSVLRVWTVGADGSETEGYMEGGKQALIGSAHPLDKPGTFLALLSGRSKGQLVSITIEQ